MKHVAVQKALQLMGCLPADYTTICTRNFGGGFTCTGR
jgi:hypothetical protein